MITVQVRKQGGAAIMTIPSDALKILHIDIGATLELDIKKNEFVARPLLNTAKRKRYSLAELLRGTTADKTQTLHKKTKWAREGKAVGREIT